MADIEITQSEADSLMAMEKLFVDENDWTFPAAGGRIGLALTSLDKRENFMLDVTRAQIKLTKATYQNRVRQAIVLMRLDLDGPPHRNPDEAEIPCPHLHIYREGFGDKGAIGSSRRSLFQHAGPVFHLRGLPATLEHYRTIENAEGAILMSVAEIERLLQNYRAWLRDRTTLRQVNGASGE